MMLPASRSAVEVSLTEVAVDDTTHSTCPAQLPSRPAPAAKFSRRNAPYVCQVIECGRNLAKEKHYYRRFRVCKLHAVAAVVHTCGHDRRYCQQCSMFHDLQEFDGVKRSCRARLRWHAQLRRKRGVSSGDDSPGRSSPDVGGENPSFESRAAMCGTDADVSHALGQLTLDKHQLAATAYCFQGQADATAFVGLRCPPATLALIDVTRAAVPAEQAQQTHDLTRIPRDSCVGSYFIAVSQLTMVAASAQPTATARMSYSSACHEAGRCGASGCSSAGTMHPKKRFLRRWAAMPSL